MTWLKNDLGMSKGILGLFVNVGIEGHVAIAETGLEVVDSAVCFSVVAIHRVPVVGNKIFVRVACILNTRF